MPHIIVTAGTTGGHGRGMVLLRERVMPADFESERFAANLVERLGWAVGDALEAEQEQLVGERVAHSRRDQRQDTERCSEGEAEHALPQQRDEHAVSRQPDPAPSA